MVGEAGVLFALASPYSPKAPPARYPYSGATQAEAVGANFWVCGRKLLLTICHDAKAIEFEKGKGAVLLPDVHQLTTVPPEADRSN